jgi:hypothetical protein
MVYLSKKGAKNQLSPTWHIIENFINKETIWLKDNIQVLPEKYKHNPSLLSCDDCILRKIATLVVSGKIKACEIQARNKDLWNNLTLEFGLKKVSRHGKEWHRKMMDVIYEYFRTQNHQVIIEPVLNYGRADLGIRLKSQGLIYVEVGTISLYKLWYNLSSMRNVTFLIIPSERKVIELRV